MDNHKRILIADDNPADYFLIRKAFGDCCPEVCLEWVRDGDALIDHLEKSSHPDIVLMDLHNMPKRNGLEALRMLKARKDFSHIPVVVLTTGAHEERVIQAYRDGFNTYIRKPDSYVKLKNFLKTFKEYWFDVAQLPPKRLPGGILGAGL